MATNGLEVNNFTTNNIANKKAANAAAKAAGTGTNPTSQLDKDAFMKLLLTELRYQDPTSPMDTEKMLSQTSQLAALETQENTNQMMKKLADQLKSSTNMYAVGVLGKMAKISDSSLLLDDNSPSVKFSSFFDDAAVGGKISIKDRKDNSGTRLKAGEYTVEIAYADENGKTKTVGTGKYMVEGIKFVDGEAKIKVGGQYISINKVKEFTEPTAKKANG